MTTVAGTVEAFNDRRFKTKLAAMLTGVSPSDIELTVAAASVSVTARILASNQKVARKARDKIDELASGTTAAASDALGVRVERLTPPAITVELDLPPAPPGVSPFNEAIGGAPMDGGAIGGIIAGGIIALVVFGAATAFVGYKFMNRAGGSEASTFTSIDAPEISIAETKSARARKPDVVSFTRTRSADPLPPTDKI